MGYGVWLGAKLRTDKILIATEKGVVKSRTIRGLPEEQSWDKELVAKIKGKPQEPVPGHAGDHIPIDIRESGEPQSKEWGDVRLEPMEEDKVRRTIPRQEETEARSM